MADALSSHGQNLGSISPTVEMLGWFGPSCSAREQHGVQNGSVSSGDRSIFPMQRLGRAAARPPGFRASCRLSEEDGRRLSQLLCRRPTEQCLGRPQLRAKRADPVRQLISFRLRITRPQCRDLCYSSVQHFALQPSRQIHCAGMPLECSSKWCGQGLCM